MRAFQRSFSQSRTFLRMQAIVKRDERKALDDAVRMPAFIDVVRTHARCRMPMLGFVQPQLRQPTQLARARVALLANCVRCCLLALLPG